MPFGFGKKWWKQKSGLSNAQRKISRAIGVPLSGRKKTKLSNPLAWLTGGTSPKTPKPPRQEPLEDSQIPKAIPVLSPKELEELNRRRRQFARVAFWLFGLISASVVFGCAVYGIIFINVAFFSWIASLPGTFWVTLVGFILSCGVAYLGVITLRKMKNNSEGDDLDS